MRYLSLFSGIGGFDLGLDRAGMRCVAQCENSAAAQSILARHWPQVSRYDDVTRLDAETFVRRVDLIVGGFPCQDLSLAGRRAGLAGHRSGLFYEIIRLARAIAPPWILLENVPGLLSSHRGKDFRAVLDALGELGYFCAWRVLDAQFFGIAQRRRRLFVVGYLGSPRPAAQILFEPESHSGNLAPRATSRKTASAIARPSSPRRVAIGTVDAPEIAHAVNGQGTRRGSGRQGQDTFVAESFAFEPNSAHYGNGNVAPTLAPTLTARHYGNAAVVIPFDSNQVTSPHNHSNPQEGDPCPTLIAHDNRGQSLAIAFHTLTATGSDGRGAPHPLDPTLTAAEGGPHADAKPHVVDRWGIRRLTPRECERLQGFPDDWTAHNAAGKPLSDSARYALIGNAVAVPVAQWIAARMMHHPAAIG